MAIPGEAKKGFWIVVGGLVAIWLASLVSDRINW